MPKMSRELDFKAEYGAKNAQGFNQKNEIYNRARWEPELKELGQNYSGVVTPKDKSGFRDGDIAIRNTARYLKLTS
jgi:hypothetical protein